jgi:hypothetical protein
MAERRFVILDRFIDSVLFLIQKVLSIRIWLVWPYSTQGKKMCFVSLFQSHGQAEAHLSIPHQRRILGIPCLQALEHSIVDVGSLFYSFWSSIDRNKSHLSSF